MSIMAVIQSVLSALSSFLWGLPLMIALIGTGLYLTIRLDFVQFRHLFRALKMIFMPPHDERSPGDISHFQALMTALAATVGTGNIAGVGTAVALGGPGALLWMWVTGLLGMATKYVEALLAIRYRVIEPNGTVAGGPMFYIERGLGSRWLAVAFALCAGIAAFGTGNTIQSNSVAEVVNETFGTPAWITGLILAFLVGQVVLGGIKTIGRVTQVLVPLMILFYLTAGITAVLMNLSLLPGAFRMVIVHAFTGEAALGGVAGAGVREAVRFGLARGLLSNESGLGSSPIAAAAARTNHPATQALVSMTQTFIDTIVVCSMTGFIIIMSGNADGTLTGARLTATALSTLLDSGTGSLITAISLAVFAYSTLLGWCYYGEIAMEYIFGIKSVTPYRIVFVIVVFFGSILRMETVWTFTDVMNALMALPNLIALVLLGNEAARIHRDYFSQTPLKEKRYAVDNSERAQADNS